jgi:hypothetical protein
MSFRIGSDPFEHVLFRIEHQRVNMGLSRPAMIPLKPGCAAGRMAK